MEKWEKVLAVLGGIGAVVGTIGGVLGFVTWLQDQKDRGIPAVLKEVRMRGVTFESVRKGEEGEEIKEYGAGVILRCTAGERPVYVDGLSIDGKVFLSHPSEIPWKDGEECEAILKKKPFRRIKWYRAISSRDDSAVRVEPFATVYIRVPLFEPTKPFWHHHKMYLGYDGEEPERVSEAPNILDLCPFRTSRLGNGPSQYGGPFRQDFRNGNVRFEVTITTGERYAVKPSEMEHSNPISLEAWHGRSASELFNGSR